MAWLRRVNFFRDVMKKEIESKDVPTLTPNPSDPHAKPSTEPAVELAEVITPASPPNQGIVASPAPRTETVTGKVTRSAGIVGLAVMGSRLLGLVREQVFANFFGASREYDAFLTAFRIPNLLRDLFAEGALSAAFVTTFSHYLTMKGEKEACRLANLVLNALVLILVIITLVGIGLAPQLVDLIAPGFRQQPGKTELTIMLTRIMYPFIILVAVAAVAMGVLNTKDRFAVPASASSFFNIGSILGGLAFAFWLDPHLGPRAMIGMAIGTLIGGALQFLIQVPWLYREGFRYQPVISFTDPGVRQVASLMGPAVIGAAAVQINVLVNNNFASYLGNGAVSWLGYAFRLMQFPIGVFGAAISMATLPSISRSASLGDVNQFRRTLASSLGLVFFLCVPSACGLIILGEPIIRMIYERGHFSPSDTQQTAAALAFYAVGLAGYAAVRVLAPAFYALDDARTPMMISLISIAANYTLNWLLVSRYGIRGLALTTSCVAMMNFAGLFLLMRRRIRRIEGRQLITSLVKITLASAVMSSACWWTYRLALERVGPTGLINQMLNALIPTGVGGVVFLVACKLLKVSELEMAIQAIVQRFRP
jgi:putative peptidoglycan lipid II flippase